jgi:hypothetical protein
MDLFTKNLKCLLIIILLASSSCSSQNPVKSPDIQPEVIHTVTNVSYFVPDMSYIIKHAEVAVIAKVEPTGIIYNWFENKPDRGDSTIWYRQMRVYRVHVQRYLKGNGEMVLYMGWPERETIEAMNQDDFEAQLAYNKSAKEPLEEEKLYLLFLVEHTFGYRPPEIDVDIFYEGTPTFNAFEILESGETKAILSYVFSGSRLDPRWTLDEFIRYIESPELIPTPTPWPTPEAVESYPIPLNTVVPYPFPLGTPFPYDTYPRP